MNNFVTKNRSWFRSQRLISWSFAVIFVCTAVALENRFTSAIVTALVSPTLMASDDEVDGLILKKKGGNLFGTFGNGSLGGASRDAYKLSADYQLDPDRMHGLLTIACDLEPGYYIYSVTQPKGGPIRTNINVKSPFIKLSQPFQSNIPPLVMEGEKGFENVKVEKHLKQVFWSAKFESTQAIDPAIDQIELSLSGQVCREGACIPLQNELIVAKPGASINYSVSEQSTITDTSPIDGNPLANLQAAEDGAIVEIPSGAPPMAASFPESTSENTSVGLFKAPKSRVSWQIEWMRSAVSAGSQTYLKLTATTEAPFHLYEMRPTDPNVESSTTLAITNKSGLRFGMPTPNQPATRVELIPGQLAVSYHDSEVTWSVPVEIPIDAAPGKYRIEGKVGYQACTDSSCEDPLGLQFSGDIEVISGAGMSATSLDVARIQITAISYSKAINDPSRLSWIDPIGPAGSNSAATANASSAPDAVAAKPVQLSSLFGYFALAMVGGLVLNLMPCVLPVIGLKIMSFVQESKQSNASVSILNLWYVAGILSVFIFLAVVTIVAREAFGTTVGWGSHFGYFGFRLGTTILMFAMALSFLGVWEIPIPGFATSQQSSELMRKEGAFGAYFKGLLTTVLATPCSGPGLGAVFSLTIDQAPWVILLMYFGIGLGMGLPYIMIAFNPSLLAFMPKPGPWMQTLKEVLAFPLLLSVVWFLTTFNDEYRIAVVTSLIFVWMGCWWIGKVPPWTETPRKFGHWTGATTLAVVGGIFAIMYLGPHQNLIEWEPYNESTLVSYRSQGKAVMIDFTAQWCANCKVNLATAIETKEVAKVIRQNGIVPMIADHTDLPEHITKKLEELRSIAIPVLAIYPAGLSNPPIVMRDLVTEKQVIEALREATGSVPTQSVRATLPVSKITAQGIR